MPIVGKFRSELTIDTILQRTSELDIFSYYIPNKTWKLNEVMCSPLREDNNPSFLVGNRYGSIRFHDFSVESHKGDVFKFVQIMYNLPNLDAVLRKIDTDLNLGILSGGKIEYKKAEILIEKREENKRNSLIQIKVRKFTKEELSYWSSYYQEEQDLRDHNIHSIKELYLNKKRFPIDNNELRFGYFYPNGSFWKVYFPNREKRKKWLGNVPLQTSWGTENLDKNYNCLIAKSLKDYLVCKKVFPYVVGIQNESISAFSEDFIKKVRENSKIPYYGGDSDVPGKQASYMITEKLGYKHINPPDRLLPTVKDMADWAKKEGLKALEEHFKEKQLINT